MKEKHLKAPVIPMSYLLTKVENPMKLSSIEVSNWRMVIALLQNFGLKGGIEKMYNAKGQEEKNSTCKVL